MPPRTPASKAAAPLQQPEQPIPLLINMKAGRHFRALLNRWLRAQENSFRPIPCDTPADMQQQARRLADTCTPIVAVAGGDGTLMTAAQSLIGTETALGILPSGTMNVFARELGIGSRCYAIALQAMLSHSYRQIDIFTIDGKPFLQMAGFGPDARIIQLITPRLKRTLGAAAHVITAMQAATERHAVITLTLPGSEELTGTQLILGNGKRYGGEAMLFANAEPDDGLLDAVMFQQGSTGILMEVLSSMLQQGGTNRNSTEGAQFRQLNTGIIRAEENLAYQLDGDYAGTILPGQEVLITKLPHTLKVCVPPTPTTALDRLKAHAVVEELRTRLSNAKHRKNPPTQSSSSP